jgi:hypothetical protein
MSVTLKDFLSPLATVVSAAGGFSGVVWTLRETRRNQEKQRAFDVRNQEKQQAFDAYDAYLKLCFEYPRFANGQLVDQGFSLPTEYKKGSEEFYRYEWFVARLLVAAERILSAVPEDEEWRGTIWSQVHKHRGYIQTKAFQSRIDIYSGPLQAIIRDIMNKNSAESTQSQK